MAKIFLIEDEAHAELQGEYATFKDAVVELKRRMNIPWNQEPNICPCTSWKTCGRNYEIVEYETDKKPWKEINRTLVLAISQKMKKWLLKQ